MRSAIDTNVISGLWSGHAVSQEAAELLEEAGSEGSLVISGPVYVELHAHPTLKPERIDAFLEEMEIDVDFALSREVWHAAAIAYGAYARRRREAENRGPKRMLADFVIGAHASLTADQLLTWDRNIYRAAFPKLRCVPRMKAGK